MVVSLYKIYLKRSVGHLFPVIFIRNLQEKTKYLLNWVWFHTITSKFCSLGTCSLFVGNFIWLHTASFLVHSFIHIVCFFFFGGGEGDFNFIFVVAF